MDYYYKFIANHPNSDTDGVTCLVQVLRGEEVRGMVDEVDL